LESGWVNGSVDSGFFAVAWLDTRSVLTLDYINFVIVVAALWIGSVYFNVEVLMLVRKVDVDVCC